MGEFWDKVLAFVEERLPELLGDLFAPWLKWIVIISWFIIKLCIEAELLAMAGPLLRSLLFLSLLFLTVYFIDEESKAKGRVSLWAASVACMVAPFWLGLCGSLFLGLIGFSEEKFKDPAVKWWIVFATHRSGLASTAIHRSGLAIGSAPLHIGEMMYIASVASLVCMFRSVTFSCICSAIVYCILLLFPYIKPLIPIALYSIALIFFIGISVNGAESKSDTCRCLWVAFIICIFAPFWLSWCASLSILVGFSDTKFKDLGVLWFITFVGQRVILLIVPNGLWSVCICVAASSLIFAT